VHLAADLGKYAMSRARSFIPVQVVGKPSNSAISAVSDPSAGYVQRCVLSIFKCKDSDGSKTTQTRPQLGWNKLFPLSLAEYLTLCLPAALDPADSALMPLSRVDATTFPSNILQFLVHAHSGK
jgi:hypothetical protein